MYREIKDCYLKDPILISQKNSGFLWISLLSLKFQRRTERKNLKVQSLLRNLLYQQVVRNDIYADSTIFAKRRKFA